jgi:endoglucanase
MAMAARYFRPYDKEYANLCLKAALKSYEYLIIHPEYKEFRQPELRTGTYTANDRPARLWAAAELWETTGEIRFLADFEKQIMQFNDKFNLSWDWGNVNNLGVITYLKSTKSGKDKTIEDMLAKRVIAVADSIVEISQKDSYARPYDRYMWGCNGTVARESLTLFLANKLNKKDVYEQTAISILDHLFGRNYYGRSYVTGLGYRPPMEPHDRRSGGDSIVEPWPGYIVGGGHTPTDWKDEWRNFMTNEIAINWQASLVYALAWFINY